VEYVERGVRASSTSLHRDGAAAPSVPRRASSAARKARPRLCRRWRHPCRPACRASLRPS
jgi:hypothetical protein